MNFKDWNFLSWRKSAGKRVINIDDIIAGAINRIISCIIVEIRKERVFIPHIEVAKKLKNPQIINPINVKQQNNANLAPKFKENLLWLIIYSEIKNLSKNLLLS